MTVAGLEAQDVTFAYARLQPVLRGWSAQFTPGTMTAVTGRSGVGKSTVLYLLGLMLRPTTGRVLVDGRPTDTMSDAGRARLRARSFGFVFQDAALDETRTVLDNVAETVLYRGESSRKAHDRALDLLDQFGVDVPANRKPGQVSGGQAQRIALCRALLGRPQFVLADEPTGNLDAATSKLVVGALRQQADDGATVVVVTHAADVATACDRSIQL